MFFDIVFDCRKENTNKAFSRNDISNNLENNISIKEINLNKLNYPNKNQITKSDSIKKEIITQNKKLNLIRVSKKTHINQKISKKHNSDNYFLQEEENNITVTEDNVDSNFSSFSSISNSSSVFTLVKTDIKYLEEIKLYEKKKIIKTLKN